MLEEELENEECDEQADVSLVYELLYPELEYSVSVEEEALAQNTALHPVPKSVAADLKSYEEYRMAPFSRHRHGSQVVSTTVSSDQANALRFLGYLKSHHDQTPDLRLLASPDIGRWTEGWLAWLKSEVGLAASTCAVYCNGTLYCTPLHMVALSHEYDSLQVSSASVATR